MKDSSSSNVLAKDHFNWNCAGNTKNFFTSPPSGQPTYIGDFTGIGKQEIFFHNPGDQTWWLGQLDENNAFLFSQKGVATPFCGFSYQSLTYIGDFSGNGNEAILTFDSSTQNWWLGQIDNGQFSFAKAGNTTNFLTAPPKGQPTFMGDFTGSWPTGDFIP